MMYSLTCLSLPFFLINPWALRMASVRSLWLARLPTQTQIPKLPLSMMNESLDSKSDCSRGPPLTSRIRNVPSSSLHWYNLILFRVLMSCFSSSSGLPAATFLDFKGRKLSKLSNSSEAKLASWPSSTITTEASPPDSVFRT